MVRSLGAGSDKGETELRLPLRLFFGFVKFCFCCLAGLWLPFVVDALSSCVVFVFRIVFGVVSHLFCRLGIFLDRFGSSWGSFWVEKCARQKRMHFLNPKFENQKT